MLGFEDTKVTYSTEVNGLDLDRVYTQSETKINLAIGIIHSELLVINPFEYEHYLTLDANMYEFSYGDSNDPFHNGYFDMTPL